MLSIDRARLIARRMGRKENQPLHLIHRGIEHDAEKVV